MAAQSGTMPRRLSFVTSTSCFDPRLYCMSHWRLPGNGRACYRGGTKQRALDLAWRASLLPPLCRARKSPRLFGSPKQRLGLVDAFLLLEGRIGIGHDAGTSLDVHHAVLDERGAQHDAGVQGTVSRKVADGARVESALLLL